MKRRNGLRQLHGTDSAADRETDSAAEDDECAELTKNFRGETDGCEGSEDACEDAENTEGVSGARSGLRASI